MVRDYLYVEDVAHAFCLAAEYAGDRRVFNVGSGVGVSINQLLAEIQAVVQRPCKVAYEAARSFDVPQIYLDISRARNELRWSPKVTLREGLQLTWNAMIEHGRGSGSVGAG